MGNEVDSTNGEDAPKLVPKLGPENNMFPRGAVVCLVIGLVGFVLQARPERRSMPTATIKIGGWLGKPDWARYGEQSTFVSAQSPNSIDRVELRLSAHVQDDPQRPEFGQATIRYDCFAQKMVSGKSQVTKAAGVLSRNDPAVLIHHNEISVSNNWSRNIDVSQTLAGGFFVEQGGSLGTQAFRFRSELLSWQQLLLCLRQRLSEGVPQPKSSIDISLAPGSFGPFGIVERRPIKATALFVGTTLKQVSDQETTVFEWLVRTKDTSFCRVWFAKSGDFRIVGWQSQTGELWTLKSVARYPS